jgi:small subunit ribosomal protein S8
MSQDILSDVLNELMNAKRAKKSSITISKSSSLLSRVLDMMKQYGYLDYEKNENKTMIVMKDMTECRAVKPRYAVSKKQIEKYTRRFLPARNMGYIIISTSKGLMTHQEAQENKLGGSIIAYFY